MRLINTETLKLEDFLDGATPQYAILSHTWGNDCEELTFCNVKEGEIHKLGVGSIKLQGCCQQAKKDGIGYAWIDTCCIDKANLVELSEAIHSMFRWYRHASVCYAYLSDVPANDDPRKHGSKFQSSRWFRRGWTLQELLAPKELRFYDSEWHFLGTKGGLYKVIGNITGIPRQFLSGVTELHAASVAQRMSWAAQRDTKKREDLAYCLLGIFGVTMPMIYGEGGDQAFFRLQEQILKISTDDSILAWGLSTSGTSMCNLNQAVPGRILATAPSDFENSGQIVIRKPLTSLDALNFFGGSIRVNLSLLNCSTGKTIGLLSCGPEHDTEKVVGIPLIQMTPSDEYVRPNGYPSLLWPMATSSPLPKLIHIKNDSQTEKFLDMKEQYWFYDDDEFAQVDLNLVEVFPRSCWNKELALFKSIAQPADVATHRIWARFRHGKEESPDFVIVLWFEQHASSVKSQCYIMICSRSTSVEDLAGLPYITQKASEKRSASNGLLNMHVILEPVFQKPIFIIRPEVMDHPPGITVDGTAELEKFNIMLESVRILEQKGEDDMEEEDLNRRAKEKKDRLELVKRERKSTEDEIKKLEEKNRMLIEEEMNGAQEICHISERQTGIKERQKHAYKRWSFAQKRLHELLYIRNSSDDYELERMVGQTPLGWAAERGHIDAVKVMLDKGADVAVTNRDGWTPLIAASIKGHVDVVRLLLATKKINVDTKSGGYGQTPLSWAAASGHEAVVRVLLDTGKVDIDLSDNNGWTPLRWAAERNHKAIVRLLLKMGANMDCWPRLNGHSAIVHSVVFSHNSKLIASASSDKTIKLWDSATGQCQRTLRGHSGVVMSVAFSHDSKLVASASSDRTIRVWNATTGECQKTLLGHLDTASSVTFSFYSKLIVSAGYDSVRIWDVATGKCQKKFGDHSNVVAISHDSKLVACGSSNIVELLDTASGRHQQTFRYEAPKYGNMIYSVAFSHDSTLVASASDDRAITVWHTVTGKRMHTLRGHNRAVNSVIFSHNSQLIASASDDKTVRFWDVVTGQCQNILSGHSDRVESVVFSHDSKLVASASYDHTIRLWGTTAVTVLDSLNKKQVGGLDNTR